MPAWERGGPPDTRPMRTHPICIQARSSTHKGPTAGRPLPVRRPGASGSGGSTHLPAPTAGAALRTLVSIAADELKYAHPGPNQ